jgi:hypothetical protein
MSLSLCFHPFVSFCCEALIALYENVVSFDVVHRRLRACLDRLMARPAFARVSQHAGANNATSATWGVGGEMDAIVRTLQQAGVRFEHYELPGMTRDGDVHVAASFKAAGFKDPDGNILHINNG